MLRMIKDLVSKGGEEHLPLFQALEDRFDRKITQAELEATCYVWALNYALPGLRYSRLPQKPFSILEFEGLPEMQRKRMFEEDGVVRNKVETYRQDVARVRNANKTHKDYLEKMERHFADDPAKVGKVREALETYRGGIE